MFSLQDPVVRSYPRFRHVQQQGGRVGSMAILLASRTGILPTQLRDVGPSWPAASGMAFSAGSRRLVPMHTSSRQQLSS
jgi:hypothetical protein